MENIWGNNGNSDRLYFGTPKSLQMVTAATKLRHLLLGRKVMTNVDSILKSRDIALPTKVLLALHIRWPKYWSFSFSIDPANEYSELISFRTDWFDLLAVQGTLKSLLQHHSSKASILQGSTFFMVQLSHPYITTGKTIAL